MLSKRPSFPTVKSPAGGHIGLSPCPGMNGDLERDLDIIEKWGTTIVVSLVEKHELQKADAEHIGDRLKERGIQWFHLPIKDCDIPHQELRPTWLDIKPLLKYRLSHKRERIVLHCWAGCGRAGMIAAKLLMQFGMNVDEAIQHVRSAKPDAIDTFSQIKWLSAASW